MNDAQHARAERDRSGQSSDKSVNRLAALVRALVAVATLLTVVLMVWFMRRASAPATGDFDKSVAVIPFALAVGDTTSADLAELIVSEVANALLRASELKLADRALAARFAGTSATVQEIGTALDVSTVLKGTVRGEGDRVRVTAALSNAHDGVVLWQQKYDRDARAVSTIADDIARSIAAQLQVTLVNNGATRR